MFSHVTRLLATLGVGPERTGHNVWEMLNSWGDDTFDFVRHQVPRIVAVFIIAFILTRLLKIAARHLSGLSSEGGTAIGDFGRSNCARSPA